MVAHRNSRSGIEPIAAFKDNYFWWIRKGALAAVVDPGDAAPVLERTQSDGVSLAAIVLTHHHADHVGGVAELAARTGATVYGPAGEAISGIDRRLADGDRLVLPELDLDLAVLAVPGHTAGHIAYAGRAAGHPAVLFCGDTLFATGCGRLFEGTPAQMQHSLARLAALPPDSLVFCAHEYTLSNIRFARAVEPDNAALQAWQHRAEDLRRHGRPTLPTTIGLEHAVNPFLRIEEESVRRSAARHAGLALSDLDPVRVFAILRAWKDGFAG
jgi:hydroxyacylglutathione hydrolase